MLSQFAQGCQTKPEYDEITFTTYILQEKMKGLIVAILIDTNDTSTHAV